MCTQLLGNSQAETALNHLNCKVNGGGWVPRPLLPTNIMTFFREAGLEFGGSQDKGYPYGRVPIIRKIVDWDLYRGPPILRNYHLGCRV